MIVPVYWISRHDDAPARGYGDEGLLERLLDRSLWTPPAPLEFDHHEVRGDFPREEGALVILNCRTHSSQEDQAWLRAQLRRLRWSVVLLCGDEEWGFDAARLGQTDTRRLWAMQARPEHQHLAGFLPGGWYPGTQEWLRLSGEMAQRRPFDWMFAGQVTHERRQQCAEVLRELRAADPGRSFLVETDHYFAQPLNSQEYFSLMAQAKVVPCPSGPHSVDAARAFEALEAGCVPVCDLRSAYGPEFDYWQLLFRGPVPFPCVTDWRDFPDVLDLLLEDWETHANRCFSFWQEWKRDAAHQLDADLRAVARACDPFALPDESDEPDDLITVIMTTSPVPQHPDTSHIVQTIASVREQLPRAEILVMCDGVRPEQDEQRGAYEEYLRRLLWLANYEMHNVLPVRLEEWGHQANAARAGLERARTPLVLFVEHDTPLVGEIDWRGLCRFVQSGEAQAVRLHENPEIHELHEPLMLDHETVWRDGLPVRRTVQWWQRPHLASARFYERSVLPLFSERSRTMIEDKLYGVILNDWEERGDAAWWDWRIWVYTPEGGELGMRRSGHLDSRAEQPKYEMSFE